MRDVEVPWWGAVSAAAAPVLLIAGLTASARLQPASFDAFNSTVSSVAAPGAADSWVMSLTFVVVGACDVVTGLALRPAARAGRITLVGAGLADVLVAAFPTHLGGSLIHAWWAGIGFAGLTLWPVLARRRARRGGCARLPAGPSPSRCRPSRCGSPSSRSRRAR